MKKLYEICRADVKIWKEFPEGAHNDTIAEQGYFEAVDEFVAIHVIAAEKKQSRPTPLSNI
jgi:abhydrolase domain-containing protein 13